MGVSPGQSYGRSENDRWWEAPLVFGEELLFNLSEMTETYLDPRPYQRERLKGEEEELDLNFRVFERMLRQDLSWKDTIHEAFTKIVRVALASKYHLTASRLSEQEDLIEKLVVHMEEDPSLRKRALYLIFLFCQEVL